MVTLKLLPPNQQAYKINTLWFKRSS